MMISLFKTILLSLFLIPCLLFTSKVFAVSNPLDQACNQGTASTSAVCQQSSDQNANPANPISGPKGIINKAANIIALVAGIGAIIMILIGGFFYVTGGGAPAGQRAGDPNAVKKAKERIVSAIIGLVIIALAWTIVRLITDRVIK